MKCPGIFEDVILGYPQCQGSTNNIVNTPYLVSEMAILGLNENAIHIPDNDPFATSIGGWWYNFCHLGRNECHFGRFNRRLIYGTSMTPPLPCDFLVSWETKFQCQYVSTGFLLSTFDFFCFVLFFLWTCLFPQFFRKKSPPGSKTHFLPWRRTRSLSRCWEQWFWTLIPWPMSWMKVRCLWKDGVFGWISMLQTWTVKQKPLSFAVFQDANLWGIFL